MVSSNRENLNNLYSNESFSLDTNEMHRGRLEILQIETINQFETNQFVSK